MKYVLSAQPIGDQGEIGFDEPQEAFPSGVIETEGPDAFTAMMKMSFVLDDESLADYDCWDLTLERMPNEDFEEEQIGAEVRPGNDLPGASLPQ